MFRRLITAIFRLYMKYLLSINTCKTTYEQQLGAVRWNVECETAGRKDCPRETLQNVLTWYSADWLQRPRREHYRYWFAFLPIYFTPNWKEVRLNKTPTWCNKMQILLLQKFSTCFGRHAPIIRRNFVSSLIWLSEDQPVTITTCTGGCRVSILYSWWWAHDARNT